MREIEENGRVSYLDTFKFEDRFVVRNR